MLHALLACSAAGVVCRQQANAVMVLSTSSIAHTNFTANRASSESRLIWTANGAQVRVMMVMMMMMMMVMVMV
jgi:hypothetical protein